MPCKSCENVEALYANCIYMHDICYECMAVRISVSIMDKTLFTCPSIGCDYIMSLENIKPTVSEELYDQYIIMLQENKAGFEIVNGEYRRVTPKPYQASHQTTANNKVKNQDFNYVYPNIGSSSKDVSDIDKNRGRQRSEKIVEKINTGDEFSIIIETMPFKEIMKLRDDNLAQQNRIIESIQTELKNVKDPIKEFAIMLQNPICINPDDVKNEFIVASYKTFIEDIQARDYTFSALIDAQEINDFGKKMYCRIISQMNRVVEFEEIDLRNKVLEFHNNFNSQNSNIDAPPADTIDRAAVLQKIKDLETAATIESTKAKSTMKVFKKSHLNKRKFLLAYSGYLEEVIERNDLYREFVETQGEIKEVYGKYLSSMNVALTNKRTIVESLQF